MLFYVDIENQKQPIKTINDISEIIKNNQITFEIENEFDGYDVFNAKSINVEFHRVVKYDRNSKIKKNYMIYAKSIMEVSFI